MKELPYLTNLIKKLAPKVGARVVLEPEWQRVGQIIYPNGVISSFSGYLLDLNNLGSAQISSDKDHAKFFMAKLCYPIAEGKTIFSDAWAKEMKSSRKIPYAINYAKHLGYPVMVKPNSKSHGLGVCSVWNKSELVAALRAVFKEDRVAIVERYLPGRDYRIVVLDGEVISAYERLPLSVTGDGRHSILALLKKKQQSKDFTERDIKIDFSDRRIKLKLRRQGFSFKTILGKGQKVCLLDNANLSSGGDAIPVARIHPGFIAIAAKLTKDMGLRFCAVDIMVTRGDISKNPKDSKECRYYIIETNVAPGLVGHYVKGRARQKKLVEGMYLKILKALGKKD